MGQYSGNQTKQATTPKAARTTGWAITVAEMPVRESLDKDVSLFGKPFSHPFLVLKRPDSSVAGEIHSIWQQDDSIRKQSVREGVRSVFDSVTSAIKGERLNQTPAGVSGTPHCFIFKTGGAVHYRKKAFEQRIFKGAEDDAAAIWQTLTDAFDGVNDRKTPYYRYAAVGSGFGNCQTVVREILARVEQSLRGPVPELKLAQTGWTAPAKTDIKHGL